MTGVLQVKVYDGEELIDEFFVTDDDANRYAVAIASDENDRGHAFDMLTLLKLRHISIGFFIVRMPAAVVIPHDSTQAGNPGGEPGEPEKSESDGSPARSWA